MRVVNVLWWGAAVMLLAGCATTTAAPPDIGNECDRVLAANAAVAAASSQARAAVLGADTATAFAAVANGHNAATDLLNLLGLPDRVGVLTPFDAVRIVAENNANTAVAAETFDAELSRAAAELYAGDVDAETVGNDQQTVYDALLRRCGPPADPTAEPPAP